MFAVVVLMIVAYLAIGLLWVRFDFRRPSLKKPFYTFNPATRLWVILFFIFAWPIRNIMELFQSLADLRWLANNPPKILFRLFVTLLPMATFIALLLIALASAGLAAHA